MPRNLDPTFAAALEAEVLRPFFALEITFISQTFYLWSGSWPLSWSGHTWLGTADLGKIGSVAESSSVEAKGTSVTLSGVNQAILQESLEDVQIGAPAILYFGALDANMQPIGSTPCVLFSGLVDRPTITYGPGQECSITISLESWLIRLSSGSQRLYTQAEQRLRFPTDTLFQWVEELNDLSLKWGTS